MSAKATVLIARSDRAALALAALVALAPQPSFGHAALLDAETTTAIRLQARYDTGEPMAGAQVIVFAPDNPTEAWRRGATDAEGRYLFAPDIDMPGRWTVQVRQAGHGAVAHVDVGGAAADAGPPSVVATTAQSGEHGLLRQAVMSALVAWGALGTALYFRRGRRDDASA